MKSSNVKRQRYRESNRNEEKFEYASFSALRTRLTQGEIMLKLKRIRGLQRAALLGRRQT